MLLNRMRLSWSAFTATMLGASLLAHADDAPVAPLHPTWSTAAPVPLAPAGRPAAKAGEVQGHVVDAQSNEPLEAVTVLDVNNDAAVTDENGDFTIAAAVGSTLTVLAPGYALKTVRVRAGNVLQIALQPTSRGETIEVKGKAPEQAKPTSYVMTADEIRYLPGAGGDVLRAVQSLPGVSRIPFNFGGLVLRGMSPRDSAVFLDGVEVPIAFHFGGVTSFYPGGMLSNLKVTPGGYDVGYGRAQGGIVELATREARTDYWRVGGEVGFLHSAVQAEGPLPKKGGIIIGVRRSYFDTLATPFVPADTPLPSYLDTQVRASWGDARRRGQLIATVFGSLDRIASNDTAVTSTFLRLATTYLRVIKKHTIRVTPYFGVNQLAFSTTEKRDDGTSEQSFSRPEWLAALRGESIHDMPWGHWRVGGELMASRLSAVAFERRDNNMSQSQTSGSIINWGNAAAWGELRYRTSDDRFSIKPGLRLEGYGLSGEWVLDPRLNMHQKVTSNLTFRQAIGRYHQPPLAAEVDPREGNPKLNSSYTDQVSLGIEGELPASIKASVTGYYNYGSRFSVVVPHGDDDGGERRFGGLGPTFIELLEKQIGVPSFRENTGRARTFGVELGLKRQVGNLLMMFNYTLARAERTEDPRVRQVADPIWHPYLLDQTHHVTALASYKFKKWRFGARATFVSGNPYSTFKGVTAGEFPGIELNPYAGRLPAFFALDLRADRSWERCWGRINLYFDIQNVTNRRNVEARDFSFDEAYMVVPDETRGLPIIPLIGVEFIPSV